MEPPSLTREPRCPFWVMAGILRQLCLSKRNHGRLRKFGSDMGPTYLEWYLPCLPCLCRDAASRVSTELPFHLARLPRACENAPPYWRGRMAKRMSVVAL